MSTDKREHLWVRQARRAALLATSVSFLILGSLVDTVHGQSQHQSGNTTYRGIILPSAPSIQGTAVQPPPAWLVAGKKASAASYGSFCYSTACVDMIPPSMRPDLATAMARRKQSVLALIPSVSIASAQVTLRPWNAQPSSTVVPRTVAVQRKLDGKWTVMSLKLRGSLNDQLLQIQVTFKSGGDVSYLWQLNPSSSG